VDGLFNGAITDKDADAKVQDAAAQTFKQIADDAHDSERDAQATIDKAVDFYKEYVDTKAQAAMAAVHRA
jgi:ABC-type transporter MlaC component